MEKKKSFGDKLEAFFAGKGFYIVLFLCVAVIGVSAWSMLAGNGADVDTGESDPTLSEPIGDEGEDIPTGLVQYPVVNESAQPTPSAAASAPDMTGEEPAQEQPASSGETAQEPEQPAQAAPDYFIWPVNGEIENAYSMTALTYNSTMRDWRTHDGLDIAAELGAQVKAAASGTVSRVYEDDMLGTTIVISHGNGLESLYANLASAPPVSEGQSVSVGQIIGSVGDTALCETGEVSHLHFAMSKDGESVDPTDYMP